MAEARLNLAVVRGLLLDLLDLLDLLATGDRAGATRALELYLSRRPAGRPAGSSSPG